MQLEVVSKGARREAVAALGRVWTRQDVPRQRWRRHDEYSEGVS
jgi:hypothetical protein